MRITAARLNDNTLKETTTTGLVAATGFSVTSFSGRKINGITTVAFLVNRTGAPIPELGSNFGNITDTNMCTLPVGWRPPETISANWGNGSVDGECTITSTGVVTLRSISGQANAAADGIATGTNPRVSASWISQND